MRLENETDSFPLESLVPNLQAPLTWLGNEAISQWYNAVPLESSHRQTLCLLLDCPSLVGQ